MIALVGDAAISYIAVVTIACIAAYHVKSRGAWWRTWMGRHLMFFMGALAAVAVLGTTKAVAVDLLHQTDPEWFQWARTLTLATAESAVVTWRLIIILLVTSRPLPGGDVGADSESETDT